MIKELTQKPGILDKAQNGIGKLYSPSVMEVLNLTQFSFVHIGCSSCYSIIVVDITRLVNYSISEMGSVPINEPSYLESQLILAITGSGLSHNFGLRNTSIFCSPVLQTHSYQI